MNTTPTEHRQDSLDFVTDEQLAPGRTTGDLVSALRARIGLLVGGSLLVGLLALGSSFLITPTFSARTTFLPPQATQGAAAAAALASLGPLAGLAGNVGLRTSGDQYVALLLSVSVADRIIDRFKLMEVYDERLRVDARRELASRVRITLGKKDGLISVEVDDDQPQRAADIANRFVEELRRTTSSLAVTEAQQRRVFFEQQLKDSREHLARAQQALLASGFDAGSLKAEPRVAADTYARLRAEATAAEVRLQTLRRALADNTPEVQQQQTALVALRAQLARVESASPPGEGTSFISKYRDFKYQETLFELYARQFELARLDESRDGTLIQVVDPATAPERRSRPKRGQLTLLAMLAAFAALSIYVIWRSRPSPEAGRSE